MRHVNIWHKFRIRFSSFLFLSLFSVLRCTHMYSSSRRSNRLWFLAKNVSCWNVVKPLFRIRLFWFACETTAWAWECLIPLSATKDVIYCTNTNNQKCFKSTQTMSVYIACQPWFNGKGALRKTIVSQRLENIFFANIHFWVISYCVLLTTAMNG